MTKDALHDLYKNNLGFKAYVDSYIRTKALTTEEAFNHKIVEIVAEFMVSEQNGGDQ